MLIFYGFFFFFLITRETTQCKHIPKFPTASFASKSWKQDNIYQKTSSRLWLHQRTILFSGETPRTSRALSFLLFTVRHLFSGVNFLPFLTTTPLPPSPPSRLHSSSATFNPEDPFFHSGCHQSGYVTRI